MLCEQHIIPLLVPSSDHLLRYLGAVLLKGGPRNVATVVSTRLCAARTTQPFDEMPTAHYRRIIT